MDELPNDKSRIERLREALYSRKVKMKSSFVLDLHGHKTSVGDKWKEQEESTSKSIALPASMSKKIFWAALGFFVVSIIIAAYVYISGSNLISAGKIRIEVIGPPSIVAGEVTTFDIAITNGNDTPLEIADLLLEYPKGTRSAEDNLTPLAHDRVAFGDIAPNTTVRRQAKSVLYGEEGKPVRIDMTLEYRVPNATSVFTKDTAFEGLVGSSPLALSIDALKEVNANQDYVLKVKVASNSNSIMKGVILEGSLPYGFEPISFSESPLKNTTKWILGDIEPKGERIITIKGKMQGTRDEKRFFTFNAGVASEKDKNTISAVITGLTHDVGIKKPFLGVALSFGAEGKEDYTASGGGQVDALITWANNLDVPLYDMSITAKLSGDAVNPLTILVGKGFYDSNKGIISWSPQSDGNLAKIFPSATGYTELAFDTFSSLTSAGSKLTNPTVTLDVTVRAKRLLESGVPQEIISTAVKTIKVATDALFSSQITHTTGLIENTGGIPPKVGEETAYTVTWAVTNTFNALSGAVVSAALPDYVEWKNVFLPSSENISYNADSRTVSWKLGEVSAQRGGAATLRKASFQIGFKPSTSQIGKVPSLVGVANFVASDTFTGKDIFASDEGLTTTLRTDPAFKFGDDLVIP